MPPLTFVRICGTICCVTVPPLPESNVVRVRLGYVTSAGTDMGSRFYVGFAGSSPSTSDCATLAGDIATAWNTNIASLIYELVTLVSVDVEDISTHTGNFAAVAVSHSGTLSGSTLTANAATNIEFDIAQRYRGGKPRMFLPPPDDSTLASLDKFSTGFIGNVNTGIAAFFAAIEALSVGSMGTLTHVSLSYYNGFTNVTNSSGRTRAVPKYRTPNALVYPVTGYACKAVVGSQRRRRTATTP